MFHNGMKKNMPSSILVLSPEASNHLVEKALAVLALRSAHQLFEQENSEKIMTQMKMDGTRFKAAAKAPWSELSEEQQEVFEECSQNIDIDSNQQELPVAFSVLLGELGHS